MHNLAIALHKKGYIVTGSDDEIFEPSKSRLNKYGLLPAKEGWDINNITNNLDAVILGMHARIDNPELIKAQELGLKIYSYPEYLYEQSKDKKRVVIGGSHGKTTITSMIMHVLLYNNIDFDYMVGANIEGFETMVKLTKEAKVTILEGDEYLTSPIDRRPKFHLYNPDIAVISGIAWDHINVFPTFENYIEQFEIFINKITENGCLIYCKEDENVSKISENSKRNIKKIPYKIHENIIKDNKTYLINKDELIAIDVFGDHNLQNISATINVCLELGLSLDKIYDAIKTFKGASKRLQLLDKNEKVIIFQDFAHSPSKLKATIDAVKKQFNSKNVTACMELHTFSSLNKEFLKEYKGAMDNADEPIVYYNPHTIKHKKLEDINIELVKESFANSNLKIYTESKELQDYLLSKKYNNDVLLLMSSGNYDGIDLISFAKTIIEKNN